jgi:hypothetical protein
MYCCAHVDYAGDGDSRKSTFGYLMTRKGVTCKGNQSCRNVFRYQPRVLSM